MTLGDALFAKGYRHTVWVNGFNPALPHLGGGPFNPSAVTEGERYGSALTFTGGVTFAADGTIGAAGTATAMPGATGIFLVRLLDNGGNAGEVVLNQVATWSVTFGLKRAEGHNYSLFTQRLVQGAVTGRERGVDLNAPENAPTVRQLFGLPAGYMFTQQDISDTWYVTADGRDSVLGSIIIPALAAVNPAPPPVDPPAPPPIHPPLNPPPVPPAPPVPPVTPPPPVPPVAPGLKVPDSIVADAALLPSWLPVTAVARRARAAKVAAFVASIDTYKAK